MMMIEVWITFLRRNFNWCPQRKEETEKLNPLIILDLSLFIIICPYEEPLLEDKRCGQ